MANENYWSNLFDGKRQKLIRGEFEKRIESLSRFLESDESHKLASISRGTAFLKVKRSSDASVDFDRATEIDSGHARAYHLRGIAKKRDSDDQGALKNFGNAINLEPEYGAAYFSRANLLTKMKIEDLAVEDIQFVQHLTNKNIETFANDNNVWRSQQLRLESMFENEWRLRIKEVFKSACVVMVEAKTWCATNLPLLCPQLKGGETGGRKDGSVVIIHSKNLLIFIVKCVLR